MEAHLEELRAGLIWYKVSIDNIAEALVLTYQIKSPTPVAKSAEHVSSRAS